VYFRDHPAFETFTSRCKRCHTPRRNLRLLACTEAGRATDGRRQAVRAIRSVGKALARLYKEESGQTASSDGTCLERLRTSWTTLGGRGSLLNGRNRRRRVLARGGGHSGAGGLLRPIAVARTPLGAGPPCACMARGDRVVKEYSPSVERFHATFTRRISNLTLSGILLLRTDFWESSGSRASPVPSTTCLYPGHRSHFASCLHEEDVRKELTGDGEPPVDPAEIFTKLAAQPASADLPPVPALYVAARYRWQATSLGARFAQRPIPHAHVSNLLNPSRRVESLLAPVCLQSP